jgi:hypothetical protein
MARGEAAAGVVEDGADQSSALRAGGAEHCDDFLVGHLNLLTLSCLETI